LALVAFAVCLGGVALADLYFGDEFSGTSVDLTKWDEIGKDKWGSATIVVSDGIADFRIPLSGSVHFPTLMAKTNPFPTSGDWILEYRMAYTRHTTPFGNGAWAGRDLEDTHWWVRRVAQTWNDIGNNGGPRLWGQGPDSQVVWGGPANDQQWHTYRVQKVAAKYRYSVDGVLRATQDVVNDPNQFFFGNVGPVGPDWCGFKVDYVRVFGPTPATVEWVGTTGYETDGVEPDAGDPDSTLFTFSAKYADPRGLPPKRAAVVLRRLACTKWVQDRIVKLAFASGDVATGAVYSATTQLPNEVYAYVFAFADADGLVVTGPPTAGPSQGPLLHGPPKLCWSPRQWFRTDGVTPNTGAAGTKFRFGVRCLDSDGDAPTVHNVRLQREGVPYLTRTLNAAAVGNDRTGRSYTVLFAINDPGTYQYRFVFADGDGNATGDPTEWTTGPTVTGGAAAVQIASLAAAPTARGAQVTFSLSGAARVTATVLNVAGRPVRTIAMDEPKGAGVQTLVWDRKADTGLAVPGGLYVVRVTAAADGGQTATALATVALR
jgi:hypothetical protein